VVNAPAALAKARRGKKVVRGGDVEGKLPAAPNFDNVFLYPKEPHSAQSDLPQALRLGREMSPLDLFSLLFTDTILSDSAKNTNDYVASKKAGEKKEPVTGNLPLRTRFASSSASLFIWACSSSSVFPTTSQSPPNIFHTQSRKESSRLPRVSY